MPKLTRIYTSGIGTNVARFSPLIIDFRNENQLPEDTIIWLRNGGGKTCWLALVYSIFRPRANHFLLKKAKGKDSSIMDFIQANDLALVITEWDISGDHQRLNGLPDWKGLRIVGQVMAWRNGQKSEDRGKLKHTLFSFRCSERVNLDTMPIMGISQSPAKSYEEFTDWLNKISGWNEPPVINPGFDDWEEHLKDIGLDPALVQFQITMNQREGDIDQYFKDFCNTPEKFTHEFLKMAFDTTKSDKVSANIVALKSKLQRREPLQQEEAFIGKFLGALEPFLLEVGTLRSRQQVAEQTRNQARGAQAKLSAVIASLRETYEEAESAKKKAKERAETAHTQAEVLAKNIAYLNIRYAQLEAEAAKTAEEKAEGERAQASDHFKSCKAAMKLADLTDLKNQEQAHQLALLKQNEEVLPIRSELLRRGAIYREILRLRILDHDQALAGIKQQQNHLKEEEKKLGTRQLDTQQKIGKAMSDHENYQSKVNQRDSTYRSLMNNSIVEAGETAIAARERLETAIKTGTEEVGRLKDLIKKKAAESEQIKETIVNQRIELTGLNHQHEEIEAFIRNVEKRRAKLEVDRNILDVTGGKTPDLEFPRLMDGLKSQLGYKQQAAIQAEVDSAEDHRASKHLDQTGLLPPPLDVEKALQQLSVANIQAFSALDYLSKNEHDPEEAMKLLLADPSKFTGIVVNRKEELEEVRKLLVNRSSLKGPIQVSVPSLDAWESAPDRITLPPASAGAFNRKAAQDERTHIFERLEKHKTNRNKLNEEIDGISSTIRELQDYLDNYASKIGQKRTDLEATKAAESTLQAVITENEDRIRANKQAIAELEEKIDQEENRIEDYRGNAQTLGTFIRDLDTDYEANKRHVDELAETIQSLTDLGTELKDKIEETKKGLDELTNRELEHKTVRATNETEQSSVQEFDTSRPDVGDCTLSQSRADYTAQLALYNKASAGELKGKCELLKGQIAKAERDYKAEAKDLHRIKVESLALRTDLKAETQRAEEEYNLKGQTLAVAKENHSRLRKTFNQLQREQTGKALKPEGVEEPSTPDVAKALQAEFESRLKVKMEAETSAQTEAHAHQAKVTECEKGIETRNSLKDDLDDLKLGEGDVPDVALPSDDHSLKIRIRAIRHDVAEAEKKQTASQERLDGHFESIQDILSQPDEPGYENAMKIKLKVVPKEALIHGASDIKDNAAARRAIILKDLEAIEQDRQVMITELDIVFQEARSLLHSAERVSRLPENMAGWAGLPFLRIKLPDLSPAEINLKLKELLDGILQEKECPNGLELAHRAVIQLAGLEGIKITILKPDVVLRPDRIPVESISYFSGGEGVTTAILLYCTLLQLRAQMHGKVTYSKDAGALLLDNPIGKCSRPDFLKMHREISNKMRVQLIYLTGVSDTNAIGTFDRIIRLRNQHKNIRTGDLHVTAEAESKMQKAEIQMTAANA